MTPDNTSREPNHSTPTTELNTAKMAKKVRKARASVEPLAASNALSTAAPYRPATAFSLVKACTVRTAPTVSLA